jgi:nitrate/TMAO reductase-like tetraheme cytochrome c subunit
MPVYALLLIGLVVGAGSAVGFYFSLEATSTTEFCTSCHQMANGPFVMLKNTTHYSNESGVAPGCADCHVPKAFVPKIIRKIQASREVWATITGKIDTKEKYLEHVPEMKAREIARLRANDSQECRDCHDVSRMRLDEQSPKARQFHQAMLQEGSTCIDCHQGIAHMTPEIAARLEEAQSESAGSKEN